mgnify:CR=1 FL=1
MVVGVSGARSRLSNMRSALRLKRFRLTMVYFNKEVGRMFFKKTSKVNKFRNFALILVFLGVFIMYVALLFKNHPILMTILMILGFLSVFLSSFVYLWVGMLSVKTVQVICPNCGRPTKILGRVDLCMFCNEPLTLDPELEGKPFDKKYNRKSYLSAKKNEQRHKG